MNKNTLKALWELLKSSGRFVYFALLGIIVTALLSLAATPEVVTAIIDINGLKISVGFLLVAALTGLAKLIDLYVRKNKNIDANGIAPEFLQK